MDIQEHRETTIAERERVSHMIAVQRNAISAWEKEFKQISDRPLLSDPSIMPSMEYMRSNLFRPPQNTTPKRRKQCAASEPDPKRARKETNGSPSAKPASEPPEKSKAPTSSPTPPSTSRPPTSPTPPSTPRPPTSPTPPPATTSGLPTDPPFSDIPYIPPYIPYSDTIIDEEPPTVIIDEFVIHDNIRACFMAFSDTGEGTYIEEEATETLKDKYCSYSGLFDDNVIYYMEDNEKKDPIMISPIPFD
jgi:hypothetical protein